LEALPGHSIVYVGGLMNLWLVTSYVVVFIVVFHRLHKCELVDR
jgi:hypothetical protein